LDEIKNKATINCKKNLTQSINT